MRGAMFAAARGESDSSAADGARSVNASARAELSMAIAALSSHVAGERAAGIDVLRRLSSLLNFDDALAAAGGVASLVRLLGDVPHSDSAGTQALAAAVAVVAQLCAGCLAARDALVAAGGVTALLALLGSSQRDTPTQEHAAVALCALIDEEDDAAATAVAVAATGGIPPLVAQLTAHAPGAHVVAGLHRLSISDACAVATRSQPRGAFLCCLTFWVHMMLRRKRTPQQPSSTSALSLRTRAQSRLLVGFLL
jgi:hypothetical protein